MKQRTHADTQSHLAQKKQRKKKKLAILLIVSVVFAIIVVTIFLFLHFLNKSNENNSFHASSETIAELESGKAYTLGQATSASQSEEEGRVANISIASSDLNNCQIGPGEVFSVNEILHDTTKDLRYAEAPAFNGDGSSMERGGGICQVVSTLYLAAIQAGLEIVERHPHSIAVDYTSMGLDATVSYGTYDLKLKNNYNRTVFLQLSSVGQTAKASILSFEPFDSQTISRKLSSEIVNSYSDSNEPGVNYYEVKSYLATYTDGQMTQKEEVSDDTYRATNG